MQKPKHVFKTVFVGDPETGKTSIIERHVHSTFKGSYLPTIGANISSKDFDLPGHAVTLVIWDIAGQAGFKNIRERYYTGANAAFIVYDVTRPETFQNVPNWLKDILEFVPDPIPLTLVGNKIDLPREVRREAGESLAKEMEAVFIETSAKTGENVEAAFANLTGKILASVLPAPP